MGKWGMVCPEHLYHFFLLTFPLLQSLSQDVVLPKLDLMWALHRQRFLKHCSNKGPYHRVQSFRNRQLQHRFPMGSTFCQITCSTMGSSPWAAVLAQSLLLQRFSIRCNTLQARSATGSSLWAAVQRLALPWYTVGCRGRACSTMGLSRGHRGTSTQGSSHSSLSQLLLQQHYYYHYYFPFLYELPQQCSQFNSLAWF